MLLNNLGNEYCLVKFGQCNIMKEKMRSENSARNVALKLVPGNFVFIKNWA